VYDHIEELVKELMQNIEAIDKTCKGNVGEDIVNLRIKQLSYAKILNNVYGQDINFLIKAYTQLGISYLEINYFEQAQEHLLSAFKLNENQTEEFNLPSKEFQIKILINLAKCYLENDKVSSALQISEKCLKMNITLLGEQHVSNADIYYVLAKIYTKLKNYKSAIDNLETMFSIYEKVYGYESEKTAKICMEFGQVYELSDNYNEAIDNYSNSYSIWEKVIKDNNYAILFTLSTKIAEIYEKVENYQNAFEFLKNTEIKYGSFFDNSKKKRIKFKKLIINYASKNKDILCYLEELLELEKIIIDLEGEINKGLAKTCISIATAYYQIDKKSEAIEYFEKAEKIFTLFGNTKIAQDIKKKKESLLKNN